MADKAPYGPFIQRVISETLAAFDQTEKQNPEWRIGATDLLIRGVLKPMPRKGKADEFDLWIDFDEPSGVPVTEIPIPLRRIED